MRRRMGFGMMPPWMMRPYWGGRRYRRRGYYRGRLMPRRPIRPARRGIMDMRVGFFGPGRYHRLIRSFRYPHYRRRLMRRYGRLCGRRGRRGYLRRRGYYPRMPYFGGYGWGWGMPRRRRCRHAKKESKKEKDAKEKKAEEILKKVEETGKKIQEKLETISSEGKKPCSQTAVHLHTHPRKQRKLQLSLGLPTGSVFRRRRHRTKHVVVVTKPAAEEEKPKHVVLVTRAPKAPCPRVHHDLADIQEKITEHDNHPRVIHVPQPQDNADDGREDAAPIVIERHHHHHLDSEEISKKKTCKHHPLSPNHQSSSSAALKGLDLADLERRGRTKSDDPFASPIDEDSDKVLHRLLKDPSLSSNGTTNISD